MTSEKKAGLLPFLLGLALCPGLPAVGLLAAALCPEDLPALYWAVSLLLLGHLFLSCLTSRQAARPILFALTASARMLFLPPAATLFRQMFQAVCLGSLAVFLFTAAGTLRTAWVLSRRAGWEGGRNG